MSSFSENVIGEVWSRECHLMKEMIRLPTREQKRVMVLNRILAGQLSAAEAAPRLHVSMRQVQRILAAYRKEGAAEVVHGNRGRKPKQSIGDEVRKQVIAPL